MENDCGAHLRRLRMHIIGISTDYAEIVLGNTLITYYPQSWRPRASKLLRDPPPSPWHSFTGL